MPRRLMLCASITLLALVLCWVLVMIGAGRLPVVAAVVAAKNVLVAALCVSALFAGVLLLVPRWRRRMVVVIVPLSILGASGLVSVGLAGPLVGVPASVAAGQLRILEWNTNGDLVPVSVLRTLTEKEGANVVVLPSIADAMAKDLGQQLAPHGFTLIQSSGSETAILTTLPYTPAESSFHGPSPSSEAVAVPKATDLPVLVAVHLNQPTLRGNSLWNKELDWLISQCESSPNLVIVGDFNATVDNTGSSLGGCYDAATAVGSGAVGTWPAFAPTWLGMPLDHVFVGPGIREGSFTVLASEDASGARHRPTLTVLDRAAQE